jgi:hypothetical protein
MIALQNTYRGCGRWTEAAIQDAVPFVPVDDGLRRAGSCLDVGTTPTGAHSCGAFTGCLLVIGHLCGPAAGEEADEQAAALVSELTAAISQRFCEEYGSVLCKDVRDSANGDCPGVVGKAAKWTAEILLDEFADAE